MLFFGILLAGLFVTVVALICLALAALAIFLVVWSFYNDPDLLAVTVPLCIVMLCIQAEHFKKLWNIVKSIASELT